MSELRCARVEELLSDFVEGVLAEPLRGELDAHLRTCPECAGLRDALGEVIAALRAHPLAEPAASLAERAAAAALAHPEGASRRFEWRFAGVPLAFQAAAAVAALLITGAVWTASSFGLAGFTRWRERAVNAEVYLTERKDRLVEDFRILRVVVATAFGSRVDRLNDRVEDYRRLLEEQHRDTAPKKTNRAEGNEGLVRCVLLSPEQAANVPRNL